MVKKVNGLEHLKKLKKLNLSKNELKDLPIFKNDSLKELILSDNSFIDFSWL